MILASRSGLAAELGWPVVFVIEADAIPRATATVSVSRKRRLFCVSRRSGLLGDGRSERSALEIING